MDRDGMRTDELEADARRARALRAPAEVHLHGPELPQPGRRDAVARAPPRAGADRRRARAARARGQPLRAAALRGRAAAHAALARRRVRHLRQHVLEDPLARRAPRAGRARRRRCCQDEHRQAGGGPVLVVDLAVLRERLLRVRTVGGLRALADRDLPPPARRDARRAGRALPARGRRGPTPRAACSSGPRCPTTSTPPTCWRARSRSTSRSCPGGRRSSTVAAARRCG